jgi:hypothetical protein
VLQYWKKKNTALSLAEGILSMSPAQAKTTSAETDAASIFTLIKRARVVGLSQVNLCRIAHVRASRVSNGVLLRDDELAALREVVERYEDVQRSFD